ncbi:MAG: MotA/TolQ/ExbB proton channel family protein [Kiritimatiellae bacterium]|nr:MotA/TolQ/ExbB proton channel family protein [Kiritimatiellia bacterium]
MKKTLTAALFSIAALVAASAQAQVAMPDIPDAQPPAIVAPAPAPAEQVPFTAASAVYGMSFSEAWKSGGWIMWVLLAISVFAVMLVLYFAFSFREDAVVPRRQVVAVREAILAGDDAAARRICDERGGAFSAVATTALGCIRATGGGQDGELLRDLVRAEGSRHAESMQSQAQLLLDLAAIAPMVGLLGTTLGMLQAFGSIAQDVLLAAKPVILAQGVSKAIVTTIAGLLVAIPCMFAYAIFRRRVVALAGRLEAASAEIVTAIAARKGASK